MPPKRGSMGPQRGGPRGGGPPARGGRGSFPAGGSGRGSAPSASPSAAGTPSAPRVVPGKHIVSIGVKRPSYGTSGRITTVITNQFELTSECPKIYHYDGQSVPYPPTHSSFARQLISNARPNFALFM